MQAQEADLPPALPWLLRLRLRGELRSSLQAILTRASPPPTALSFFHVLVSAIS